MTGINANWGTPEVPLPPMEHDDLAGFWVRLVATVCDGLNAALFLFPVAIIGLAAGLDNTAAQGLIQLIEIPLVGWWIGTKGGSPLRRRWKVLVIDADNGSFVGAGRGIGREFVKGALGMLAAFGPLGVVTLLAFLWMLWDRRKQTLYDKVVRTVVVSRR